MLCDALYLVRLDESKYVDVLYRYSVKAPQTLSVINVIIPQQCVLEAERDENVGHITQQEHEVRQAEPGQQTVECALHRPGEKRFRGIRGIDLLGSRSGDDLQAQHLHDINI